MGLNVTHLGDVERLAVEPGAWIVALFAGRRQPLARQHCRGCGRWPYRTGSTLVTLPPARSRGCHPDGQLPEPHVCTAEQTAGACQQQLQALGTAVVDLAGLLRGAAVNVSRGCTQAAPGSSCSVKEAFGVDLAALSAPGSAKQGCSSQLVLLPHQDVRDASAWPKPYTGAACLQLLLWPCHLCLATHSRAARLPLPVFMRQMLLECQQAAKGCQACECGLQGRSTLRTCRSMRSLATRIQ